LVCRRGRTTASSIGCDWLSQVIRRLRGDFEASYNKFVHGFSLLFGLWESIPDAKLEAIWLGDPSRKAPLDDSRANCTASFSHCCLVWGRSRTRRGSRGCDLVDTFTLSRGSPPALLFSLRRRSNGPNTVSDLIGRPKTRDNWSYSYEVSTISAVTDRSLLFGLREKLNIPWPGGIQVSSGTDWKSQPRKKFFAYVRTKLYRSRKCHCFLV
jgi:hypothetical protein